MVTLYAIALPVLLGALALALDGGKMFVAKIHAQNAADAAALASAQELHLCSGGPSTTCDPGTLKDERIQVETYINIYSMHNGGPKVTEEDGLSADQCAAPWYLESTSQRISDGMNHDGNCYTWPYVKSDGSHWDQVEVRIRNPVDLAFAHLVGISNPQHAFARGIGAFQPVLLVTSLPGVTTVGPTLPGQTHTYIFSTTQTTTDPSTTVVNTTTTTSFVGGTGGAAFLKSTACEADPGGAALEWSGAASTFKSIILNGGFNIPGANTHHADHLWVGKHGVPGCELKGSGASITQITGPFSPIDWPLPPPSPAPPAGCLTTGTGSIGSGWVATHPSGVYCWTSGALQISANGTRFDGYSFYAPSIGISSNGMIFNPSLTCGTRKVLFDAYAGDFTMSGGGDTLNGDIYATNGNISVTGGGAFAGCGYMETNKMSIGGNFAGYNGTGPGEGGGLTTTTQTTTTVIPGGTHTNTFPSSTSYTTDPSTVLPGVTTGGTAVTATTATNVGLGE
jgi:Putative Flp pilus-assembly TadE/G-like